MLQMTIDDVVTTSKRTKDQIEVGTIFKLSGWRMEVIISSEDIIVLYCYRKEKIYPLRFIDGCFAQQVP